MADLLKKAFDEARRLPSDEQEFLGRWLLEELATEHRWSEVFARSQPKLEQLADEALEEHRGGRTRPLDPDRI